MLIMLLKKGKRMTKFLRYVFISTLLFSLLGCTLNVPHSTTTPSSKTSTVYLKVPSNDCEIRKWYNYQVVAISLINKRWIEEGIALEERAKMAYALRHNARMNARYMMQDKKAVKVLQERDMKKYGNPDGPDFSYLIHKSKSKGIKGDEVYKKIIESSSRTNAQYNADCMNTK
ncbi:MAG: Unknown protein [uncultured Sulfurovum sp.]|uniref:Lipoprotein n=1 Tax=uncultured Sulfurovum sp. TaxID=269237 RepID=A0A6S6TH43_9BACT|nr:MAG: Unknown protein [uncultured Sulfurovum sp.]